jgi:predicted nucleotidyltransferase
MKILDRKYLAIDDFTRRLLNSEVKDLIAKVLLFGSVRKGDARAESDVDLLVLATSSLE